MKKSEIYRYKANFQKKLNKSTHWRHLSPTDLTVVVHEFVTNYKKFEWKHDNIEEFFVVVKQLIDSNDNDNLLIALEMLYNLERK